MSPGMEDRLRAAYQAKAEQLSYRELVQLRAERSNELSELLMSDYPPITRLETPPAQPNRRRHSRWLAPAAAAAVVAVVATAALALSAPGSHRAAPAPPASKASSPTGSISPSVTSSPSPTASPSTSTSSYLPAGQTGARADVPWSQVGTGWRLVQPDTSSASVDTSLYLYDPAGGRYLISDQLPTQAYLQAWSPDGQRAMFQSSSADNTQFRQLDLHTGQLDAGFRQFQGNFVSYTQPRGLAVMVSGQVQGTRRLLRYGTDGTLQLAYPPLVAGLNLNGYPALYTDDGSQFVTQAGKYALLLSNGGQLVEQFALPAADVQACRPVRWWTSGTFLESCDPAGTPSSGTSLYLQPITGGPPSLLVDATSSLGLGYSYGWPLSNGDVLLARTSGCGSAGYDVLHPDGSIAALRLPAGVSSPGTIQTMVGDVATFRVVHGCGDPGPEVSLLDYNMVTGATSTLLNSGGAVVGYPGQ